MLKAHFHNFLDHHGVVPALEQDVHVLDLIWQVIHVFDSFLILIIKIYL